MKRITRKIISILVIMQMIMFSAWQAFADDLSPEGHVNSDVQSENMQSEHPGEETVKSGYEESEAPAVTESSEPAAVEALTAPEGDETAAVETPAAPEGDEAEAVETPAAPEADEAAAVETPAAPEGDEAEAVETPAAPEGDEAAAVETPAAPEGDEAAAVETPAAPEGDETAAVETPAAPEGDETAAVETPAAHEGDEAEAVETPAAPEGDEAAAVETPAALGSGEKAAPEAYNVEPVTESSFAAARAALVSKVATGNADDAETAKTITIDGTSIDGSEDKSGSGWNYEKESGRIVLRDYTGSADITSDGTGVDIVSTGYNRIGTLSCDGDINVIGTGVLLVDKVELAENCSFNLLPLREYYGEDGGSVAVFILQEDGSYRFANGKVKGIIDERLELPEDIRLVFPDESLLELQALRVKVETDENGNKTIIRDLSGYSELELYGDNCEYYGGHLLAGDIYINKGATIKNNHMGDAIVAGIIAAGNLINDGTIIGGSVTVVQKDSGAGGLYSGSGIIEDSFITFRTGQTMSINLKDSALNLELGEYTIEHLGVTGSSELYYGGNFEIKNIDGASGSSLNIYSFDMGNNLKLTESINNTEVLIKSGITELKAGLQFLNWGTINNETYGGPIFNYSGIPTVSDGVKGSVFLGPDNVKIPDPDSIPVVSFYLHKTVDYNWNITLKENMEEWQGYTILDDYDATIRRYREINYDELIETYFPDGLDFLKDGQSIVFEVLRCKDGKLSMTILGDGYEHATDSDGVFLIRLAYLDPWHNQHGGTNNTSTRASQTGTGNIGGNSSSIITGTGLTRFSSLDPEEYDPDPVKPDPDPVKPDPNPVKPDPKPVKPDPSPVKPDPDPVNPDPSPVKPDPDPVNPDPVKPDPDPVIPDPDPVKPDYEKTVKKHTATAVAASGDTLAIQIYEFNLNEDDEKTAKVPCYNLSAYINGVQVSDLSRTLKVEMDYVLPEKFKDKPLYAVFANEDEASDEILRAVSAEYDEESGTLVFETSQLGDFIIAAFEFDGEEFSPDFYDELEKTDEAKLFIKHLKEKKENAGL
ncbi:MAG: hypothetical protein IJJ06_10015 [Mogibacterium sp.]|nr:hypothetical protein [Mogibacterium sp.]